MAFIAPLLVPLLGTVGAALAEIGLAVGLGYAARKLSAKSSSSSSSATQRGRTLQLTIDTAAPRQAIFGRQATAGSLVYWQTAGDNNEIVQMVIALADHECEGLAGIWADGKERTWNSETGIVSGYGGNLKVRFYTGNPSQTVDIGVRDQSGGRWTDSETGAHVCYVVVAATYEETSFPGGIPQMIFVVDGAKLYDPRYDTTAGGDGDQRWDDQSTWEFTANPAVATYNALRGFSAGGRPLLGLNAPADAIRMSDFEASANVCDETVNLLAGGTEPRYRCGHIQTLDGQPNRDAIGAFIQSMAGDVICAAGIYRIIAGVARSSVVTLTDEDLIIDEAFTSAPRLSRNELTNAVTGSFTDPERSYNTVPLPPRTSSEDETADGGIRLSQQVDLVAVNSRTQGQRIMEIARKRARRQGRDSFTVRARWFGLEVGDWITINSTRRGYSSKVVEVDHVKRNPDLTTELTVRDMDDGFDDWLADDELADDTVSDLASGGPTLTTVASLAVTNVVIDGNDGAQRPGLRATWTAVTDPTVVAVRIEYRKQGDTVALEKRVEDPTTGQYTWVDGIQGGLGYEIRAIPVTVPERALEWTSWVQPSGSTGAQKVDVAISVPPDTITEEMLDPQARFELGLVTAVEETLGSVSSASKEAFRQAQTTAENAIRNLIGNRQNKVDILVETQQRLTSNEAFAQQISTLQAALNNAAASIVTEQTVRAEAVSSLASQTNAVSSALGEAVASVVVLQESVDGIQSQFGVAVNGNGQVLGYILLDGTGVSSSFDVVANRFRVALPDVAGGDAVPVFSIQEVNGSPKLALRGDMVADGSILARHIEATTLSAISADLGTITAGLLRNADNTMRIDLDNKEIFISTTAA